MLLPGGGLEQFNDSKEWTKTMLSTQTKPLDTFLADAHNLEKATA